MELENGRIWLLRMELQVVLDMYHKSFPTSDFSLVPFLNLRTDPRVPDSRDAARE